jgi:transcriptional regulator with XRE-family HTH domain
MTFEREKYCGQKAIFFAIEIPLPGRGLTGYDRRILKASERIKNLRQVLGFSQRELAKEFDVSPAAVALWENGSRPVPGPVRKLLDLYESSVEPPKPDPALKDEAKKMAKSWAETLVPSSMWPLRGAFETGFSEAIGDSLEKAGPLGKAKLALFNQVTHWMADSKGLAMKAAQMASYIHPSVPPELREAFAQAVNQASPVHGGKIARVIAEELGAPPHKIFKSWATRPFAVASIGQVHLAELKTGERVAVKVQHPGIRENIEKHFRALSALKRLLAMFSGEDTGVFEEIRSRVIDECDYELEADYQEKFRNYFSADPVIQIPRVFREFSSKRVLTTEFVAGVSLNEFDYGLVYGDPHPGNFIFTGDRVAVVDFGRVSEYERGVLENQALLYRSVLLKDKEGTRKALADSGTVKNWETFDFDGYWELMQVQQAHHLVEGPFRMTPDYIASIWRAARDFKGKSNLRFTPPMLWAMHVNASLWSILAELEAEANWREQALELLSRVEMRKR